MRVRVSVMPCWLLGVLGFMASGCVELDLGNVPFYCNNGSPKCPEGYVCVTQGSAQVCRREGLPASVDSSLKKDKGGKQDGQIVADSQARKDGQATPQDQGVADLFPWKDKSQPVDFPPIPKDQSPKLDVPKLGCQNNQECKQSDPSNPCCCQILLVWVCMPICATPLCIPL